MEMLFRPPRHTDRSEVPPGQGADQASQGVCAARIQVNRSGPGLSMNSSLAMVTVQRHLRRINSSFLLTVSNSIDLRVQRAKPEAPEGRKKVAQGKRSAALGHGPKMNIPLLSTVRRTSHWAGAADRGKKGCYWCCGYPGRQSLRSFAQGYSLLAPTGQIGADRGRRFLFVYSAWFAVTFPVQ